MTLGLKLLLILIAYGPYLTIFKWLMLGSILVSVLTPSQPSCCLAVTSVVWLAKIELKEDVFMKK